MDSEIQGNTPQRTAADAGWHVSRYNLSAPVPGKKVLAIANLFKGTCAEYNPIELYLMGVLDQISDTHPIIERLSKRGVIANFDEQAALETMGRGSCAVSWHIGLTICHDHEHEAEPIRKSASGRMPNVSVRGADTTAARRTSGSSASTTRATCRSAGRRSTSPRSASAPCMTGTRWTRSRRPRTPTT